MEHTEHPGAAPVLEPTHTSDGLPVHYAAEFGFALLSMLLIGMTLLLAAAAQFTGRVDRRFLGPQIGGMAASMVFAIFIRYRYGLKGVLTGALVGLITMALLAGMLCAFLLKLSSAAP